MEPATERPLPVPLPVPLPPGEPDVCTCTATERCPACAAYECEADEHYCDVFGDQEPHCGCGQRLTGFAHYEPDEDGGQRLLFWAADNSDCAAFIDYHPAQPKHDVWRETPDTWYRTPGRCQTPAGDTPSQDALTSGEGGT